MSFPPRYALLLDGAFVTNKLQHSLNRFPNADDVVDFCDEIKRKPVLKNLELLRMYFYHAPPAVEVLINPIDRAKLSLANSQVYRENKSLIDKLELKADFALRLGEVSINREWIVREKALKDIVNNPRYIQASDIKPDINQKGVDLRIGLDIARIALKQLVGILVVATGDSDLIPAFKFARREGIRVYLETMGHGVKRELKVHADLILS